MTKLESSPLIFETIKIANATPLNLSWHQKRVDFTFGSLFKGTTALRLQDLIVIPDQYSTGIFRCKFIYNEKDWSTEFSQYTPRQVKTLKLIDGNGIAYPHKFNDRSAIDLLYDQRGECDDVLIVNDGYITDTSIANILFSDGKNWFTPSTPLLPGTTRARLMDTCRIFEKEITIYNYKDFSHFMLINALNDFNLDRILSVDFLKD